MCGRFALRTPAPKLAKVFAFKQLNFTERYNIAPTQDVAAVRAAGEGSELVFLRWGLIPPWSKDPRIGHQLINARAETVAEKPSFRSAFKHRRCLVLVDGFFEWVHRDGKKQPYYITLRDGSPFSMDGLWEEWHAEDGEVIESSAVITTEANAFMRPLYTRMPVILDPENYADWLDPAPKMKEELLRLLRPCPSEKMQAWPVSARVNNPRNDTPDCIKPALDTQSSAG